MSNITRVINGKTSNKVINVIANTAGMAATAFALTTAVALATPAPDAKAYTSCSTYGNTTYCNGDSGSSTYSTYGNSTYYDTPYGSGSCSTYGSTTTCW